MFWMLGFCFVLLYQISHLPLILVFHVLFIPMYQRFIVLHAALPVYDSASCAPPCKSFSTSSFLWLLVLFLAILRIRLNWGFNREPRRWRSVQNSGSPGYDPSVNNLWRSDGYYRQALIPPSSHEFNWWSELSRNSRVLDVIAVFSLASLTMYTGPISPRPSLRSWFVQTILCRAWTLWPFSTTSWRASGCSRRASGYRFTTWTERVIWGRWTWKTIYVNWFLRYAR